MVELRRSGCGTANVYPIQPRGHLSRSNLPLQLRQRSVQHHIQFWRVTSGGAFLAFECRGNSSCVWLQGETKVRGGITEPALYERSKVNLVILTAGVDALSSGRTRCTRGHQYH